MVAVPGVGAVTAAYRREMAQPPTQSRLRHVIGFPLAVSVLTATQETAHHIHHRVHMCIYLKFHHCLSWDIRRRMGKQVGGVH